MSARIHSRTRRRQKPRQGFLAHLLDPIDTLSEIIFSVLILLTFTLAFRIFMLDGRPVTAEYVNEVIWAALRAVLVILLTSSLRQVWLTSHDRSI